jgi:RNA 3'-phosphate cyclase
MSSFVEIDGSMYEGGGAIVRVACALSAITKKPCRIFNIRAKRPKPGLMTQHLLGLRALAEFCNGKLEGDYLNSTEIKFYPGEITKEKITVKIPTAGSITLVLQTLIPVCIFAKNKIEIYFEGGATDTFFSPTIDHFRHVFLKILEKMLVPYRTEGSGAGGPKVEIEILKRGYYPEGGAKLKAKIFPAKLKPINLTKRGEIKKILIISRASQSLKNKRVAERQVAGAKEMLRKLNLQIEEKIEYYDTQSPGSQICLIAEFENTILGMDNLGKLGKRAEDVGKETAIELLKEEKTQACLDRYLADQILPYMALAEGKSQVTVSEITEHCKTNIWVIEKFISGKFEIKENLITWSPK